MSLYLIAHTNFGHDAIKLYEPVRKSINDKQIIELWNNVLSDEDDVLHLSDFAFKSRGWDYAKALKGKITLLKGNHDFKKRRTFLKDYGFIRVIDSIILDIPLGKKQVLEQHLHDYLSKELLNSCVCWIQDINHQRILFSHYPCFYEDVYAKVIETERKVVLKSLFE